MKRNFRFEPITVVEWQGALIDLHNAYDIEAFGTSLDGGELTLSFNRNNYAIGRDILPAKAELACKGNVRVAFNDLNAIAAPLRQEGIEIAYFDDSCEWDSFTDERIARSQEPSGLHIFFVNGLAVRVFCDEATFAAE